MLEKHQECLVRELDFTGIKFNGASKIIANEKSGLGDRTGAELGAKFGAEIVAKIDAKIGRAISAPISTLIRLRVLRKKRILLH